MSEAVLAVSDLSVSYPSPQGASRVLRHVDFTVGRGEVVGIVGESGCGKSTLAAAIPNLLPADARVDGSVRYKGVDIRKLSPRAQRRLRGPEIAMVFQDPMAAFNPVLTIGSQLVGFQHHRKRASRAEKRSRALEMLERVGIGDPEARLSNYPHELSGGMCQRAAIAAALLMNPGLLIADEPTTALDVTTEAQIIHLLRELQGEFQGSIVVVSHHLGLIAELCDRVYVMYAGEVAEEGDVDRIFHRPQHPYTRALLACDPAGFADRLERLPTIAGSPPSPASRMPGCPYAPRCGLASALCVATAPGVRGAAGHSARCHEAAL